MNNYFIGICIVLLAFLFFKKFLGNQAGKEKIKALKTQKKTMFLVDVRQPSEFNSGTVKGAVNIPLGEIQKRINEFKGKENIIVFCQSGGRSSQASSILNKNGYKNVINGGSWNNVASTLE